MKQRNNKPKPTDQAAREIAEAFLARISDTNPTPILAVKKTIEQFGYDHSGDLAVTLPGFTNTYIAPIRGAVSAATV